MSHLRNGTVWVAVILFYFFLALLIRLALGYVGLGVFILALPAYWLLLLFDRLHLLPTPPTIGGEFSLHVTSYDIFLILIGSLISLLVTYALFYTVARLFFGLQANTPTRQ